MNDEEIRIGDLLITIVKRWKTVLVLTLLGFGFGFVLNSVSFVKGTYTSYEITCSIAITAQGTNGNFANGGGQLTSGDFQLAEDMADAVSYVLWSDRVLEQAIEDARLIAVSADEVARNLGIRRYNETQVLELTLWWPNAEAGIQLMNSILSVARQVLPETLMIGSVATIDAPEARYTPTESSYTGIWIIATLAGLAVGLGIVAFEFFVRPTLLNPKAVEESLGLEMLGIIPNDHAYFQKNTELLNREPIANSTIEQNFASTAYILCNRLGFREKNHCIYITSAEDGEGKSTVAANLAIQMSDLEKRVLLIDLNLGNPSLGGMFLRTVDYSRTLNALYKGDTTAQEAVVSLTGYLDLLPTVLERNAVNLDSALFEFISQLAKDYEYVIIDAPSIGQSSDVLRLNQVAKSVLFVIRYDMTPLPVVKDALDQLDKSGIRILGCVVNASKTMHGVRSWRERPGDQASRGMRDVVEMSDLALAAAAASEAPAAETGGGWTPPKSEEPQSVLDELTDDPVRKNRLSDDEAIDALLRMGTSGSWKRQDEPAAPEQPEQPAKSDAADTPDTPAPDATPQPQTEPAPQPEPAVVAAPAAKPAPAAPVTPPPAPAEEEAPAKKGLFGGRSSKRHKPKH